MAAVMIGIDPHKASHTAVAIGAAEEPLGELRIRACPAQAERLLAWAVAWPERTWAIEGAGGLGHLLAQQLLAAGERVLDVQPKLGARVRLLANGAVNKNDPNDARSVAVAALRSPTRRQVQPDDHAAVLKVWSKRHRDLGRTRTQIACRLHAVLCELIAGGVSKEITAAHAAQLLESITPAGAVEAARCELAAAFLDDLRRIDAQLLDAKKKLTVAVRASGTTLTQIFGVGPVVAGTVIGAVRDVSRFPDRDHFAAYNGTAPIEVSSGPRKIYRLSRRGNRRLNHVIHMAAVTQIRYHHSDGRAYYDRKLAEGKTPKEALRALKRRVSDAIFARLRADAHRAAASPHQRAREGRGVPRGFRTADPYRIFTGKDGITCQGNTGSLLPSSVRKRPAWSWRRHGRSRKSPASLGLTRPVSVTGCGPTVRSTRGTSRRCSCRSGRGCGNSSVRCGNSG
jgi:transposase